MNNIVQKDLITLISEHSGVKPKKVRRVIDALETVLIEHLKHGEELKIDGLGVFRATRINASQLKNTYQSDYTDIPAFKRIYFRADKKLKDKLNNKES